MILFEILIALSLTAILLTFLFSFFVESTRVEKKLELARTEISAHCHLQTRLQAVFTSIDKGAGTNCFYTKQFGKEEEESLVAIFDNQIDPDPMYSGSIVGRIFLDSDKNLCLACWPLEEDKNIAWRKEILMSNIDHIEYEFLGKKGASEHAKKEKITPVTSDLAWRGRWPKSQGGVPSMIRLLIFKTKEKQPLRFAFILPTPEPFVTYLEKKLL